MLFSEEDSPLLKKWIVKRLENTSDADADVLADYVLALLRHDGDIETVRALCEREMPDFLKEDSTIFVRDVFDAINYKSYLPGGAVPPPRRPAEIPFAPPSGPSYGALGNSGPSPINGSRKRSYNERGDVEMLDRGFQQGGDPNGRAYKQPRRGGPGIGRGGYEPRGGRGGFAGNRPPPMNMPPQAGFPGMPAMPSPPPGMPFFDPREGLAGLEAMLGMGLPMSVLQGIPQGDSSPPPRQMSPTKPRCRDYDIKGFCARGNTCPYEHGQHSIWVPPTNKVEEYDPTTSLMSTLESNTGRGGLNQHRGVDRGRGRGQRGNFAAPSRRSGRAEFSSNQPNFDKNNCTIVVENIPEDKFSEDEVRAFFSEFGNILEVSMRPYKRLAIVKYDDWNSAKNAYSSPKVIFDNRFVKVYWYVDQDSLPKPPAVTGANGEARKKRPALENGGPPVKQEPAIDLEEFARKQAEAQKTHEEKLKKKAEMEAAKKELEKRQEELLKNQAEEKRKLMEKIAAKSGKSASPAVKAENGTPTPVPESKSSAQTEALKAQLAALEAEAKSLGIDPNAVEEAPPYGYRGRGRGRGVYRGRATFPPRGFRGAYRGRGGAPFSADGRSFNLDNRPKKVALTGVDFTDATKEESLREYLFGIGEYTDIEITPARTSILFKDRFTAEKFFKTPNKEIPSVGKVDMAWVQTPLPPVNLLSKATPTSNTVKVEEDTNMDEGDAMASSPAHAGGEAVEEQNQSYDYDVAGEDEWN